MSPEERAAVVDALPAAMTDAEASPPEGDDWVLGVHVGGDRKKDAELNVARYARLGPASTSSTIGPDSG